MKINITLSLDEEVVHYLKGQDGYSSLANRVLKDYIEGVDTQDLVKLRQKLQEIKQNQAKIRRNKKEIMLKIKKIKEKESKILKLCRGLTETEFNKLQSADSLMRLAALFRSGNFQGRMWIDLKKIWIEVKGGGSA